MLKRTARCIALCLAPAPAGAIAQCYWQERDPRGLVNQYTGDPVMVFDSARQRSIAFVRGYTSDWNGLNWTPRPRGTLADGAAAAFDSARGITVLFGGGTWEFNGAAWVQRQPTLAPSSTWHHAMAYDAARQRTVLFGGEDSALLAQTWTWDGTNWSLAAAAGPPARADHAMVYDTLRARCVLYGGRDAAGAALGDTWEWDGASWSQVPAAGPASRIDPAMAFDPGRGRTILFGGRAGTGQYLADLWEFDGAQWLQLPSSGPPARRSGAMCYDARSGRLLLTGGNTGSAATRLRDFWSLDQGGQWTQIAGFIRPPARYGHTMAYDSWRRRTILYGGWGGFDHWEWDGHSWVQQQAALPTDWNGSLAFDRWRGVAVLFGSNTARNDTWEWDGLDWTQRQVAGPPNRALPGMAYDSFRRRTIVFGGFDNVTFVSRTDTWEWDGLAWVLVASAGPPSSSTLAYDSRRGVTVAQGSTSLANETWEWNGQSWQLRGQGGPQPRSANAMVYDAARDRTVLFNGSGIPQQDTWEWNGVSWSLNPASGPSMRNQHAMAYDSHRARVVLFGGNIEGTDHLPSDDTWELVCPCYPNCDGSTLFPTLNVLDFGCFLNKYAAGDSYANCDNSTNPPVLNVLDFGCFLNRFAAGCP